MTESKTFSLRWWWVAVALLGLLRLYLTSDRDILAIASPIDEYWFIQTAIHKIWSGSYNEYSFIHLPTYAMWLDLLHAFGVPTRLAIDLLWVGAGIYLAYALVQLTKRSWIGLLSFSFLAFQPSTIAFFDRTLAETFLAGILTAALGAAIEIWNCRDRRMTMRHRFASCAFGCGFAVAFHTRDEGVTLFAPIILLACWSIYDYRRWWLGGNKFALALPLLIAPLVLTITFGAAIAGGNYLKWGVWARYELEAPGYEHAMAALERIDAGRTPRQITVTHKMLVLAYRESPTLRELEPAMDGAVGQGWIAISTQYMNNPGEIGDGWFYWALRDAAATAGWFKSARIADKKFTEVANELNAALASGRLKKRRFAFSAFLDPDYGKWISYVPRSILNVSALLVNPQPWQLELLSDNATPEQFDQYVLITGRRVMPPRFALSGWVAAPFGSFVGLGADNSTLSWTRLGNVPRTDVPGAWRFSVSSADTMRPTELQVISPDGKMGSVQVAALSVGETKIFNGSINARVGVDSLNFDAKLRRADHWFPNLCIAYDWLGFVFCAAALMALVASSCRQEGSSYILILICVIAAVGARVAVFAILDSSSWNGLQARYMLPALSFFACGACVSIAYLYDLIASWFVEKRTTAT